MSESPTGEQNGSLADFMFAGSTYGPWLRDEKHS